MSDFALTSADANAPALALEQARVDFFARVDAFCAVYCPRRSAALKQVVTQARVSQELFGCPRRLKELRGGSDIGVTRLAKAERDLAAWAEREGISLSLNGGKTDGEENPNARRSRGSHA